MIRPSCSRKNIDFQPWKIDVHIRQRPFAWARIVRIQLTELSGILKSRLDSINGMQSKLYGSIWTAVFACVSFVVQYYMRENFMPYVSHNLNGTMIEVIQ